MVLPDPERPVPGGKRTWRETWRERWQRRRQDLAEGAPGQGVADHIEDRPLDPAPAQPAPAPPVPAQKLTWREKRWQRRRRRKLFEEVLGWILVPIILVALYWAVKGGLNAAGTSPSAVVQAIKTLISGGGAQP
ncbi:MAG TPA: hypothetical protein VF744_08035 [Beijerinckiaceae bacterium]|jgi:hypothetical protein